jgi:phospholipid-transporting ATPase
MGGDNKVVPVDAPRQSHCNAPEKNATIPGGKVSNEITTAKYSVLNFFPKNLFGQFQRLANVYFLLISCLQLFTDLSPTSKFSTAAPFALVLILNMAREAWEDSARHKADKEVNERCVEVVRPSGQSESVAWRDLLLGDLVCVKSNNEFPADLVLLSSSGDQGMCYIDTCNLDGETNLKIRNSLPQTKHLDEASKITKLEGLLEFEQPNNRLYTFTGRLVRAGQDDAPIDNDNILLRGSTLRNTDWIYGIIVYVGPESKIMMNSKKGRNKSSNVEHIANYIVLAFLLILILIVSIATACMGAEWNSEAIKSAWYIPYASQGVSGKGLVDGWITILLLLNNYVPISLYVSMEFAKAIQGQQINWDLEMYHKETDTPALTRTTNLNEELGQIQYILSDKTGTLTQNVMEFRKLFIKGVSYGFGTTEIGKAAAARGADLGGVRDVSAEEAEKNADANLAQVFIQFNCFTGTKVQILTQLGGRCAVPPRPQTSFRRPAPPPAL